MKDANLLQFYPKNSFTVISKGRVVNIPFADIIYIKKYANETFIHTTHSIFATCMSLQQLLNDLPVNSFFRIHRSYVVSLPFLKGISRHSLLAGAEVLPISAYYKQQLLAQLKFILSPEAYSVFLMASHS